MMKLHVQSVGQEGEKAPSKGKAGNFKPLFFSPGLSYVLAFHFAHPKNIFGLVLSIKYLWSCTPLVQAWTGVPLSSDDIRIP